MNWLGRVLAIFRAWQRQFALWLLACVDHCPVCEESWALHRCPLPIRALARYCDYQGCGLTLPIDAIRTHEGKWRCKGHKSL